LENGLIAQLTSRIETDQSGLQQITSGNPDPVNDAICKASGSAAVALECDIQESQDTIYATQGTLELLKCRSGYDGTISDGAVSNLPTNGAVPSATDPSPTIAPPTPAVSQTQFQKFEDKVANSPAIGDAAGAEQTDATANALQVAANNQPDDLNATADALLTPSDTEGDRSPAAAPPPLSSVDTSPSNVVASNNSAANSVDNGSAPQSTSDQSDAYSPQDAQDLLETGLSQTTSGQVVTDIQEIASGDGQKQLNGTFDLADKANDQFNPDESSKYVVGQCLPLIHNVYSNAMGLLNGVEQDVHCITDPNCSGVGSATETQWNQIQRQPLKFFSPPANENIFNQ
jgi:hypothetical protein